MFKYIRIYTCATYSPLLVWICVQRCRFVTTACIELCTSVSSSYQSLVSLLLFTTYVSLIVQWRLSSSSKFQRLPNDAHLVFEATDAMNDLHRKHPTLEGILNRCLRAYTQPHELRWRRNVLLCTSTSLLGESASDELS